MHSSPNALVSIIIRSTNRSSLDEALQSAALQTHPTVEIVVVAASGPLHPPLADRYRGRAVVFVPAERALGRSEAANAGLDAANGELLCFLDDDDILLPHHASALSATLANDSTMVAAYGRVRCEDTAGNNLREFGRPYDVIDLQLENYLPIHSVLFRRAVITAGCRFDPRLDLCEDWDFWRQVSMRGPFAFHDELVAIYRIGVASGFAVNGDPLAARQAEQDVSVKWLPHLPPDMAYQVIVRARSHGHLQQVQAQAEHADYQLNDLRDRHRALNEALEQSIARENTLCGECYALQARCAELEAARDAFAAQHRAAAEQLQRYEHSRSWRLTHPLRAVTGIAHRGRTLYRGLRTMAWPQRLQTLGQLASGNVGFARSSITAALAPPPAPASPTPPAFPDYAPLLACEAMPVATPPLTDKVDILIPVYNGFEFLPALFDSLKSADTTPYRVLICDDASPDERVWPWLEAHCKHFDDYRLLRNPKNLGFIGTVNRLFKEAEHHFVLLNTDVEVPPGWLERLFAPIFDDATVASVTPFTNAGAICSFPHFFRDNPIPDGMTVASIDAGFRRLKPFPAPQLTTGVGFCMAIRLDVARQIGMFDPIYGKGYREENDWSRRAELAGYRHVLAANLFVMHKHGGSFSNTEKNALSDKNEHIIRQRYPGLFERYQQFIDADPLKPIRDFLQLQVLAQHAGRPAFVIIDNEIPGGAQAYRQELVADKLAAGIPVLRFVDNHKNGQLQAHWQDGRHDWWMSTDDYQGWGRILTGLRIEEVFLNNIYSFRAPLVLLDWLTRFLRDTGTQATIALHDFYMTCPSLFLIDYRQQYCALPDDEDCAHCFGKVHLDFPVGASSIGHWRAGWRALFQTRPTLLAFSNSTAALVTKIYPESAPDIVVRPHSLKVFQAHPVSPDLTRPLHIGIVGAVSWHKGREVVKALCEEIERNQLPIRITVIGTLVPDYVAPCLHVTGPYPRDGLAGAIEASQANMFFFPSIWPETFSYVAHEIMACGVPFCCFDIGAPAESAQHYRLGRTFPIDTPVASLLDGMRRFLEQCATGQASTTDCADSKDREDHSERHDAQR